MNTGSGKVWRIHYYERLVREKFSEWIDSAIRYVIIIKFGESRTIRQIGQTIPPYGI